MMLECENIKVKEIDKKILEMIIRKMDIKTKNVDILTSEQLDKIIRIIDRKKEIISLLFQGDFSVNEKNIEENLQWSNAKPTIYEKIANNIVCKRVEEIMDKLMEQDPQNGRLISVCIDRMLFIQKIISQNVDISAIKKLIPAEKDER